MSITIRSSSQEALKDPALLRKELDAGHAVELTDIGAVLTRLEDVHALADRLAEEELLEHMASFRTDATGVDNTIWVSPKGRTRRAARIKVAIDPPDSLNATSQTASVAVHDGSVADGHIPSHILRQVQEFVKNQPRGSHQLLGRTHRYSSIGPAAEDYNGAMRAHQLALQANQQILSN